MVALYPTWYANYPGSKACCNTTTPKIPNSYSVLQPVHQALQWLVSMCALGVDFQCQILSKDDI